MRKVVITDLEGNVVGSIAEQDGGSLVGDGKGESLVQQAPGKTIDDWLEADEHSRYLHYAESDAGPAPA